MPTLSTKAQDLLKAAAEETLYSSNNLWMLCCQQADQKEEDGQRALDELAPFYTPEDRYNLFNMVGYEAREAVTDFLYDLNVEKLELRPGDGDIILRALDERAKALDLLVRNSIGDTMEAAMIEVMRVNELHQRLSNKVNK